MKRVIWAGTIGAAMASCAATTWTIYPTDHDGMTPSQQITNAATRASSGDTILFKPGTYQLDGESFMGTTTKGSGTSTITSRNYVYVSGKALHFVGEAEDAWSDEVVLRGNGFDRFAYADYGKATFSNLTFENFAASDRPDLETGNNLDVEVTGGAVRYSTYHNANILSNCVFRGNVSRSAGAVAYAAAIDCLFTNNIARSYGGGAAMTTSMRRCLCVANMATNSGGFGGALWWTTGQCLRDSTFIGNRAKVYAGALVGDTDMSVSNCVFRGNVAEGTGIGYWNGGGGAACLRDNAKFLDCVFEGNHAESRGGAVNSNDGSNGGRGTVFDRCIFSGNSAIIRAGAVCDGTKGSDTPLKFFSCTFSGNTSTNEGMAVYCGEYSNCTFTANYVTNAAWIGGIAEGTSSRMLKMTDCVVSNNYSRYGGMIRYAVCTNTLFYGNEVPRGTAGKGGVICQCQATDCRFVGNRKYDTMFRIYTTTYNGSMEVNNPSGDACQSTLVKCDMDLGCIHNCVLVDCHIHTLTNKGAHCAFYGHNAATNCLIEDCKPPDQTRGLIYRWGPNGTDIKKSSDYVNCTFAGNKFPYCFSHPNESGFVTPFKNCLFYNNRNASGNLIDMTCAVKGTGADSGLSLSNCVFGAAVSIANEGTWHDLGGNKVIAPDALMVAGGRAAALGVHKYSLRPESPAIGMGDASMFSATDLDYAGNLRLREGRLDPGCFECWLNILGTRIIFR